MTPLRLFAALILFCSCQFFVLGKSSADLPDMKLKVEITKSGYVGQPIEYRVLLTSNSSNIQDVRAVKNPSVSPDCQIVRGRVTNQKPVVETINGQKIFTWTILRNFIIAKAPGKYEIGEGDFIAYLPFERIVDDFFWGRRRVVDYEEVPLKCEKVSFKVSNLPKNKPENFSDAVGQFSVDGWFPPGEIRVGNEAIVVLKIEGYGNLESLKLPNVAKSFVNGCSLVNIERNDAMSQKNGSLYSEVTLTCTFIPRSPDGEIDPVSFVFFNPDSKKYETVNSKPLQWNVNNKKKEKKPSYDVMEI